MSEEYEAFADLCRIPLSYSRLRVFMECRRKYKLLYVDKITTDKTPALVVGGAAHHALEQYVKEGCISVEELVGHFMGYVEQEPHMDDIYIAEGVSMLDDWWKEQRQITPAKEYKVEQYFEMRLPNCLLRGYIDRLEVENGRVDITDYKTGKSELGPKGMKKDLQLPIYALAMRELYPNQDIYCSLYYLRSGHKKTVQFTNKELDRYADRIDKWAIKMINEEDFKACWSDFTCRMCPLTPDYCDWPAKKRRKKS